MSEVTGRRRPGVRAEHELSGVRGRHFMAHFIEHVTSGLPPLPRAPHGRGAGEGQLRLSRERVPVTQYSRKGFRWNYPRELQDRVGAVVHVKPSAGGQNREFTRRKMTDRPPDYLLRLLRSSMVASSSAIRALSGTISSSTSSRVIRGVMCCGQFQSNAAISISRPRSTFAR